VNGSAIDEPYIAARMERDLAPVVVPKGTVYVLGDNRNDSHDSRYYDVGPVSTDLLLGEVHAVIWPVHGMRMMTDYTGQFAHVAAAAG
jgi:signal peptidase I